MTSILELNDDCLIHIFSFLDIYELIKVETVCKLFEEICRLTYKKYSSLRIDLRYLNLDYFGDILDRVSPYVQNFEFSGGYILPDKIKRTFVDELLRSPKLKRLTISYVQFPRLMMIEFSECFKNLVYLNLGHCNIDEDNMEGVFADKEAFKNLKTLVIGGNTLLTGTFIKNLIYIEDLDCSYCYEITYKEFVRFLQRCLKLLRLDISGCIRLQQEGNIIEDLIEYQGDLEKLHFKYSGLPQNDPRFKKFKKMKDLNIDLTAERYVFGT